MPIAVMVRTQLRETEALEILTAYSSKIRESSWILSGCLLLSPTKDERELMTSVKTVSAVVGTEMRSLAKREEHWPATGPNTLILNR